MTLDRLRSVVANRMKRRNQSARALCQQLKLGPGHHVRLSAFLRGEQSPQPKLLHALGYRRVEAESYVRVK